MAQPQHEDNQAHHRVDHKTARLESRREREFYRYYEPIQALTDAGPLLCNLHDESAIKAHRPRSSPDRALTAFCQLGALRLGCKRAMLFFFDRNYAYVLAEATRTLSLQNDDVHDDADDLWLGHTVIPRGFSICEETVARLPSGDLADPELISHIINDLDHDAQFCGKPYVRDGPKAKFYAGVPITTSKGINIGAYCCLDDRKRDGLDTKSVAFLQDMAKTVMTHLEYVRAKAEHERGTHMVSALGAFIEGAHSVQSSKETSRRWRDRRMRRDESPEVRTSRSTASARNASNASARRPAAAASFDPVSTPTGEAESDGATERTRTMAPSSLRISRQTNLQELQDMNGAPNIRDTFRRAAELIREAVESDGVAFLAGSASTYGGLAKTEHDGSDQSSDAPTSAAETGEDGGSGGDRLDRRSGKPCRVLASSHSKEDGYNTTDELQHDIQTSSITERFLRSLLRRNPGGKIWQAFSSQHSNFSEDGAVSSDDSSSESTATSDSTVSGRVKTSDQINGSATRHTARERRNRVDDGREIQRLFPGVRSLALCGMWDQNRGRWYSACAVWTYSPLRVFSQESEVSYTAAFCDVIMAEVYRLEAQNSDKAKSDFISSISHELRSPLHGILGSVECLQDMPSLQGFASELVSQVEVCGRTLVDIVEHLLDYSKLNHQVKAEAWTRGSPDPYGKRMAHDEGRVSQTAGLVSSSTDISLDTISEEVIQAAVYSYCCSKSREDILKRKVSVILDVDHERNSHWRCTFPVGAWKRICINLVSNALKYTSVGFIHITLKAEPVPGKRKRLNALLVVQDTGRGMSREYMENHLFRAFSQENNLVEGTGLGMSLVAKIVKAMGGKIDVQSHQGVGTTMTVSCPMNIGRASTDKGLPRAPPKPFKGRSIGLLQSREDPPPSDTQSTQTGTGTKLLWNSLQKHCTHLGIETRRLTEDSEPTTDVNLIFEQDLKAYIQRQQLMDVWNPGSATNKPLIIVCNSAISARQLRATSAAAGLVAERVEYIAQPCGTERLRKVIRDCLPDSSELRPWAPTKASISTDAVSDPPARLQEPRGLGHKSSPLSLRTKMLAQVRADQKQMLEWGGIGRDLFQAQSKRHQTIDSWSPDEPCPPGGDYQLDYSWTAHDPPRSPCAAESAIAKGHRSEVSSSMDGVTMNSGLSMLLVDDNPINLRLLVNFTTKHGHRKITAVDGQQAVEAYKVACLANDEPRVKPEVILMDINMPVMDGYEATRRIRSFEQQHDMKPAHIVALTGLGSAEAQQEAFTAGVDLYLTKPVQLKELTKILDELRGSKPATVNLPALSEV